MNSQNGAKVDYQDFDERTVDFIKKLKRVFADINIRIAAVEAIKTMADDFERRYGQVALDRIDAGIAPVLAAAIEALDQTRADLAALDAAYRENGIERVDAIINPLIAAAQAALIAADQKVAELEAFLATKQSVAEKGQANGYAGLDAAGKVPTAQLPALTTTATVGAALAGANQEATPADGDRLAGIKAGGSTAFWVTLGNLKALLKAYFDAYVLDRSNHTGKMPVSELAVSGSARFVIGRTATNGNAGQVLLSADPLANSVALRGAGGILKVGAPEEDDDAATRKYVDDNASSPGVAKAWVNFNGTNTVAIRDSFNVSSITDNGVGDYTINFAAPLGNAKYACAMSTEGSTNPSTYGTAVVSRTASALRVKTGYAYTSGNVDMAEFSVIVFGA
ncbi:hypothetical protein [Aquamicrobium sp.]|uniref:hypothetical protein n=1 Tax=Aquamicrobium sp. TaxID=1872579 RepID=UPI00258D8F81|nr:hypothetical protein [Aquamicrobium sp.]MCK9549635.1 hypothetical protein [Aquamicrobium sp.]